MAREEALKTHGGDEVIPVWQQQPASFLTDEVLTAPLRHVSFSEVVKRPRVPKTPKITQQAPVEIPKIGEQWTRDANNKNMALKRRRVPRTAIVTITCPQGKYAEVMSLAKKKVSLDQLNIEEIKMRRAITGAMALEIKGPENNQKADNLATALSNAFKDRKDVRISHPIKTAEPRP